MFSVFLLSYSSYTHESLGELEKAGNAKICSIIIVLLLRWKGLEDLMEIHSQLFYISGLYNEVKYTYLT